MFQGLWEGPWSRCPPPPPLDPPGGGKYIHEFVVKTAVMLKVECLLTSAIWSYGHEAEVYIFLNLPFPSNPQGKFFNSLYFEHP